MSVQHTFGNLIDALVLAGIPPQTIAQRLPALASDRAARHLKDQGEGVLTRKIADTADR